MHDILYMGFFVIKKAETKPCLLEDFPNKITYSVKGSAAGRGKYNPVPGKQLTSAGQHRKEQSQTGERS
jgi:hypothetical protein